MYQGVELGVPDPDYRAAPGFSQSEMKEFSRSPAHYRALKENPRPTTAARRLGQLSHLAVFEPDSLETVCAVAPVVDKRTKDGKAAWAAFEESHRDRFIVSEDEFDLARFIRDAVHVHPVAQEYLQAGFAEVSVWAQCPETEVLCKGRLDWLTGDGVILDLKTTEDAGHDAFARSVASFKHHWQAAHYTQLLRDAGHAAGEFLFIAVEKAPPFGVAVYKLEPEDMDRARNERRILLQRFAECLATDCWPCYDPLPTRLSLPGWSRR